MNMVNKDACRTFKRDMQDGFQNFEGYKQRILENKGKEVVKDIFGHLNQNSRPLEDDKESKRGLFQSHLEKIEKQLENKRFESPTFDHSSHHHGFNSRLGAYFIPKIDMRKFDSNDPIIWIVQME